MRFRAAQAHLRSMDLKLKQDKPCKVKRLMPKMLQPTRISL